MTVFSIAMGRAQLSLEKWDAGHCQLFVKHLSGSALNWFSRLEVNSTDSFQQLSTAFLKHYSMYMQKGASDVDLWALDQGPKESLRTYMDRLKAVVSRAAVPDRSALAALRNGLWYESKFKEDLLINEAQTLEDAMHRSIRYIVLEEDRAVNVKKFSPAKLPTPRENLETIANYVNITTRITRRTEAKGLITNITSAIPNLPHRNPGTSIHGTST